MKSASGMLAGLGLLSSESGENFMEDESQNTDAINSNELCTEEIKATNSEDGKGRNLSSNRLASEGDYRVENNRESALSMKILSNSRRQTAKKKMKGINPK